MEKWNWHSSVKFRRSGGVSLKKNLIFLGGFKVFRLCAWICTTLVGKIQKIIIEKGHVAYVEVAVLCSNQLKNAEIASFSCFFQYFTHMFAVLSESWKIRCIFLQEKQLISIHKKVRKLLFLLHMAKHGPTVLCFQCFCSIFLCWTWISQNWFPKHGHLSSKKCMKCIVFMFFKILVQFSEICRCMKHVFTRTTRDFNDRKLLFLLQMTKHGPTFHCFQCFVPFFSTEHGCLKINLPHMAVYHQKKVKN